MRSSNNGNVCVLNRVIIQLIYHTHLRCCYYLILSVWSPFELYIYVYISLINLFISTSTVHFSINSSVHPTLHSSHPFIHPSIQLSTTPSIHSSIHPTIHFSIHSFIPLSIQLSTPPFIVQLVIQSSFIHPLIHF